MVAEAEKQVPDVFDQYVLHVWYNVYQTRPRDTRYFT